MWVSFWLALQWIGCSHPFLWSVYLCVPSGLGVRNLLSYQLAGSKLACLEDFEGAVSALCFMSGADPRPGGEGQLSLHAVSFLCCPNQNRQQQKSSINSAMARIHSSCEDKSRRWQQQSVPTTTTKSDNDGCGDKNQNLHQKMTTKSATQIDEKNQWQESTTKFVDEIWQQKSAMTKWRRC